MKTIMGAAALTAMIHLSGCASILSDSSYPVSIQSSPERAEYVVTDTRNGSRVAAGTTPDTVTLRAKHGFFSSARYQVSFEKEGYKSATRPLDAGMDGWYFGNILLGGLLGILIIDPATGAMWKLDESLQVGLDAAPVVRPPLAPTEAVPAENESLPAGEEGTPRQQTDTLSLNERSATAR
ncbi:hypothetical protein Y5W_01122 [Alcanivorax sp. 521-1]|uniref:PEGA domain-containing protein n=1 Tax=Alloalcanivorax profundimaris TaxID=2735259 RepID=A0ABS0ANW2_9GAMM|nr:hypothetical protein [Alloalcanivorax profundimaris]MBF5055828.1 hypothetical protein [Alloalcanivorax profundimaris]